MCRKLVLLVLALIVLVACGATPAPGPKVSTLTVTIAAPEEKVQVTCGKMTMTLEADSSINYTGGTFQDHETGGDTDVWKFLGNGGEVINVAIEPDGGHFKFTLTSNGCILTRVDHG